MKVILQDITKLETDALIVGFFEDVRPLKGFAGELDWLLCGSLAGLLINNKLRGSLGDIALLTSRGKVPARKIFMVGLGPRKKLSSDWMKNIAEITAGSVLGAGAENAVIEYFPPADVPYDIGLAAMREGFSAGAKGRGFAVSLLARDTAAFDNISRFLK